MATSRNKRKLAAFSKETQEEHPRNNQSRNTSVPPGITDEFITQVSDETVDRVTKKLSQEITRTESRISGALSKLDKFFLNPQIRKISEPFRERHGTMRWKTRNQLAIIPRMTPILKWSSLFVGRAIQTTQTRKRPLTTTNAVFFSRSKGCNFSPFETVKTSNTVFLTRFGIVHDIL